MILFQTQTRSPLGINGWVTQSLHTNQGEAQERMRELKYLHPDNEHRVTEYTA